MATTRPAMVASWPGCSAAPDALRLTTQAGNASAEAAPNNRIEARRTFVERGMGRLQWIREDDRSRGDRRRAQLVLLRAQRFVRAQEHRFQRLQPVLGFGGTDRDGEACFAGGGLCRTPEAVQGRVGIVSVQDRNELGAVGRTIDRVPR